MSAGTPPPPDAAVHELFCTTSDGIEFIAKAEVLQTLCGLGYASVSSPPADAAAPDAAAAPADTTAATPSDSERWCIFDTAEVPGVVSFKLREPCRRRLHQAIKAVHALRSTEHVVSLVHQSGPVYPLKSRDEVQAMQESLAEPMAASWRKAALMWAISNATFDSAAPADPAAPTPLHMLDCESDEFVERLKQHVLFRCSGLRHGRGWRTEKPKWKSPDAERAIGESVVGVMGWRAAMLLFNLHVLLVISAERVTVGISLHGTNPVRSGHDFSKYSRSERDSHSISHLAEQGRIRAAKQRETEAAAEALRQRLLAGETYASISPSMKELEGSLKQTKVKNEIRIAKSENSMLTAIAHGLLVLADIKPGDVVCDPMAGSGTTLLEAAFAQPDAGIVIGGDFTLSECSVTALNVSSVASLIEQHGLVGAGGGGGEEPERKRPRKEDRTLRCSSSAGVCRWDAMKLPLRSGSVDAIVSDFPFGNRCVKPGKLVPAVLSEMGRILRPGGRAVYLVMQGKGMEEVLSRDAFKKLFTKVRPPIRVNMGEMYPFLYCLQRL